MMKETFYSRSPGETETIAASLAKKAQPGDFYALFGDLAAGKTVFARGFTAALAPNAMVSSPTYAILNVYREGSVSINHFDTYRITSEDDLMSTGFFEAIEKGITLCEWPEKILYALPERYIAVRFEKTGEFSRTITVERISL